MSSGKAWLLWPSWVLFLALAGCVNVNVGGIGGDSVRPSGNVTTIDYDYRDFTAVAVSDTFQADVQQGDAYGVTVRVDENLVDSLEVRVDEGRLSVGLKRNTRLHGSFTIEVSITMPDLTSLDVSGASQATVGKFQEADSLVVHVSGASGLGLDVSGGRLDMEFSGASRGTLGGAATVLLLNASGASTVEAEDLVAERCQLELSGASTAHLRVTGVLGPATLSGASTLTYTGSPQLERIHTSGASSVQAR